MKGLVFIATALVLVGFLGEKILTGQVLALSLRATPAGSLRRAAGLVVERAIIQAGTLSAKNGNTLTVTSGGNSYSVLVDATTQLRRRFWGKATLDEMQVGDTVNVIGKWTDDAHSTIQARLVRDASIQKRFGVFFGTVTSLNPSGWVMNTVERGTQTVAVSSSTKFVNRKGQMIAQTDIKINDKVRVRGLWDNKANMITEVAAVKDYNSPPVTTTTP